MLNKEILKFKIKSLKTFVMLFKKKPVSTNCLEEKQILLTMTRYTMHFKISVLAFLSYSILAIKREKSKSVQRKFLGSEMIGN